MIALILLATFIASIFFLIRICFKSYSDNNTNGNISSNKSKKNTFSHSISKLPPQVKSIKEKFGLGGSGTSVITISISKEALSSKSYRGFATVLETLALICPVILIQLSKETEDKVETVTDESNKELKNQYPKVIPTLIPEHRILNYKKDIGKVAILRQLRPSLHIEYDPAICTQVAPFMRVITVLIDGTELGLELSTAHHSTSVGDSASKSNNSAQYSSVGSILELLQVP